MEAVVGLMLMLLGVSHAVETHCEGRQDGAQCYVALGGTVVLQLVDRTSDIYKFQLMFNTSQIILTVKENNIISNLLEDRSIFTPSDGTFRIRNLSRSDGGEYTLEMFNSQGQKLKPRTLQLFIQAPVSSVMLLHACLSQGELKVSCLSEGGDSPEYSWTLDGRTLTDDKLLPGNNKNNTIILKQDVSGLLACSVKNNVSHVSDQEQISTCGFIHIECDINGTHISQWVYEGNNTLCIGSTTTTQTTVTEMEPTNVAVETHCDGRRDGAQCYGALGGTVVLQLVDRTSDIYKFQLMFNTSQIILNAKENNIISNLLEDRSIFTPSDGTFRIRNLSRSDGGEYTLEMFNSQGQKSKPRTLQLFIQAPVSSVMLVSECLSQGIMRVSCSSEGGDSPEYSWTLDGHTLTDDKLLCGNHETNIIILKQDVSGGLACSVRNHISHGSKEEQISTCKDNSLLTCGLLFVMATLSVGGIFLFFHFKKKTYEKNKMTSTSRAMEYSENSSSVIELRS